MDKLTEFKVPHNEPRGVTFDRMVKRVQLLTFIVNKLLERPHPNTPTVAEMTKAFLLESKQDSEAELQQVVSEVAAISPLDAIDIQRQFGLVCHCVCPRVYQRKVAENYSASWCEHCNRFVDED